MTDSYDGQPDDGWMDDLEGGTFVSFKDQEPKILEFLESTPRKRPNKWGKDVWEWDVRLLDEDLHEVGNRKLSTQSLRMRRQLKMQAPLKGKVLRITPSGNGLDTDYDAVELKRS